jgi:RNA polymerase sigma factor (sigma-70 family)
MAVPAIAGHRGTRATSRRHPRHRRGFAAANPYRRVLGFSCSLNPQPSTLDPRPSTLDPRPGTAGSLRLYKEGTIDGGRPPLDESAAIERARRGDGTAYELLVRRYQDLAFRTAFVITGDAAEAEDAAQSGFVKAYFALPRFRPEAPFRPWLLQIVANEARNRRTAASRHPTVDLAAIAERPAGNGQTSPELVALAGDERRRLVDALNQLREEDRAVIVARYFLDLNEAEMASALNCPRGTVKSRLSRALGRLREELLGSGQIGERPEGTSHV